MKTLADILKALEAIISSTDLVAAQNAAQSLIEDINEFDTGYRTELNKKNSEARGLRDRLKKAEEVAGLVDDAKAKYKNVLGKFGLSDEIEDIDAEIDTLIEKIKSGEASGKSKTEIEAQLADLRKQLTTLTKQAEQATISNKSLEEQLTQERTKRHGALKQTELLKILTAGNAVKPNKLAEMLMHNVEVDSENDDALLFVDETGEKIALSDGLTKFLKDNPEFVKNSQRGGAGSGSTDPGNKLRVTRDQLKDPSFYKANRDAILKGDVEVIGE